MVASGNHMSPVGSNIKNAHKGDLLYNEWLLHRNMIVNDVNIIRELIDVHENYKSINVLTMIEKYVYKINNVESIILVKYIFIP